VSLIFTPYSGTGGDPGDTAQLLANDFTTEGFTGTVFSGVQFHSNGLIYERQAAGGFSSFGAWLVNGTNSDFYLRRTIDSGTLDTDSGGTPGDLRQMNTTRTYDIQRATNGEKEASVTFTIVDVGDTVVYASRTYDFFLSRGLL